ncbi:DsbA family protein [Microbacterium sp. ZW T5_56]|uniref:DsbA family protein n=1 Tax=Microbacterium sp. ZW T5_56 TaxID=3378081 RepID=UPI0038545C88
MKTSTKATLISIAVVVLLAIAAVFIVLLNRPSAPTAAETNGALTGTRANSHVVDRAGEDAPTLVEYLDFECEACAAFHPVIAELREHYDGRLNYVVRYFPLAGHFNSMNAALAVEAAAQQDRFLEMHDKMFDTQAEWGEQQVSAADTFRGYAEELGLDLAAYDAAIEDPATRARIEEDMNDGKLAGVRGTPTFVLDGKRLELMQLTDLTDAIDSALAR